MGSQQQSRRAVVVPAVGAASSVTCLRSLAPRGVHAIAVAENENAPAFCSRYCDESVLVPSPAEDLLAYKDALLELARRSDVRTIVPVREPDIYVLSQYCEAFAEHVSTLWPSFDTLGNAHDRVRLVDIAAEAGVTVPETRLLSEVDDWDRRLIVKSRHALVTDERARSPSPIAVDGSELTDGGTLAADAGDELDGGTPSAESRDAATDAGGSNGAGVTGEPDGPDAGPSSGGFVDVGKTRYLDPGVSPDTEAIAAEMYHDPVAQEYVPGTEYTFRALYDEGEPIATCQKRAIRGYKYARGPSVFHEATDIPELTEAGLALLDALEWHGVASVGFIHDERTGEFTLLEINPRFWSSLPSDLPAGVDFPNYYWRVAGGESVERNPRYETGKGTHLLRGEAAYLHSILFEDFSYVEKPSFGPALWNVARSLVSDPRFDYLSLDDPKPFVRDLRNRIAGVL
jgi:predicted ATP-grasp superfamily ATP-dependent carboligase